MRFIWAIFIFFAGCINIPNPHQDLPSGKWRAIIKLDPTPYFANPKAKPLPELENLKMDEVTQGELPFFFETNHDERNLFRLINSNLSYDIVLGRDKSTAKDTISIALNSNSNINAIFEENIMEGTYTNMDGMTFPFVAWYGKDYLFTELKKEPKIFNLNEYHIKIQWSNSEEIQFSTLYVEQEGNDLVGSLDGFSLLGTIQKDKFYLSGFDGNFGILIEAKLMDDQKIMGSIRDLSNRKGIWIN